MTDRSAIGYAILAAERLGLSPEQRKKLDDMMNELMDEVSQEEAAQAYNKHF